MKQTEAKNLQATKMWNQILKAVESPSFRDNQPNKNDSIKVPSVVGLIKEYGHDWKSCAERMVDSQFLNKR